MKTITAFDDNNLTAWKLLKSMMNYYVCIEIYRKMVRLVKDIPTSSNRTVLSIVQMRYLIWLIVQRWIIAI